MAIQRWEPFAHLRRMEEMDRIWPRMFRPHTHVFRPFRFLPRYWVENGIIPIDMYHTDDALVVKVTIPGYKPEDVELSVTGDELTLKGQVKGEKETKEEDYLVRERRNASVSQFLGFSFSNFTHVSLLGHWVRHRTWRCGIKVRREPKSRSRRALPVPAPLPVVNQY